MRLARFLMQKLILIVKNSYAVQSPESASVPRGKTTRICLYVLLLSTESVQRPASRNGDTEQRKQWKLRSAGRQIVAIGILGILLSPSGVCVIAAGSLISRRTAGSLPLVDLA